MIVATSRHNRVYQTIFYDSVILVDLARTYVREICCLDEYRHCLLLFGLCGRVHA